MVAIIVAIIVCLTMIICTHIVCETVLDTYVSDEPVGSAQITQEDLDNAYKDMESEPVPDFQDVIAAINEEFGGVNNGE